MTRTVKSFIILSSASCTTASLSESRALVAWMPITLLIMPSNVNIVLIRYWSALLRLGRLIVCAHARSQQ